MYYQYPPFIFLCFSEFWSIEALNCLISDYLREGNPPVNILKLLSTNNFLFKNRTNYQTSVTAIYAHTNILYTQSTHKINIELIYSNYCSCYSLNDVSLQGKSLRLLWSAILKIKTNCKGRRKFNVCITYWTLHISMVHQVSVICFRKLS